MTDAGRAIKDILKLREPEIDCDLRLSRICTFKIGGVADAVITPSSETSLIETVEKLQTHHIPIITIGAASNLLFSDTGLRGAVLRTRGLNSITLNNGKLICGAGVPIPTLCRFAAANGLGGFHGLCGIPGTVGGAVVTAAGAFGCNIYDMLESCRALSITEGEITDTPCHISDFSYRKSPFSQKNNVIILSATFKPTHADNAVILDKMKECTEKRLCTQPHGERSAGSYFKRPTNAPPAAYLIDRAGLKGITVGGAAVSEKHAGFIINKNNATANDVLTLADAVKAQVFAQFGVTLTEEVIFIK